MLCFSLRTFVTTKTNFLLSRRQSAQRAWQVYSNLLVNSPFVKAQYCYKWEACSRLVLTLVGQVKSNHSMELWFITLTLIYHQSLLVIDSRIKHHDLPGIMNKGSPLSTIAICLLSITLNMMFKVIMLLYTFWRASITFPGFFNFCSCYCSPMHLHCHQTYSTLSIMSWD